MGLFSLFYGIPPTYEPHVQTNKITPVLVNRLLDRNYRMGIFSSYRITIPASLDLTVFARVPNLRCETVIPGPPDPWRKDSAITRQWPQWLDASDSARPFFGFLFYDAMLKQKCPPAYEKRAMVHANAGELEKNHRKYELTMTYIDSLIGSVLDDLIRRDLLSSTIVMITADHGLEFDENHLGFTGHGSAFSDYQLRVPLYVAWPGKATGTVSDKRTSHYDICVTLMQEALGCSNPPSDYSSGNNIFSSVEWNWLAAGSYFNNAVIEPQQVTIQYPTGYYEVRDHRYQPVANRKVSTALADAFSEMSRFFVR